MKTKTKTALTVAALLCAGAIFSSAHAEDTSWQLGPFVRPEGANPVIKPDANLVFDCPMSGRPVQWAALHAFNPAAVVKDGRVCVLFRAEDASGTMRVGGHTSRIGLAESDDGVKFVFRPAPVLFPANDDQKAGDWTGGCEDPRVVVTEDGTYVMMYTAFSRDNGPRMARLCVATSRDLVHWTKHGAAFAKYGPEWNNRFHKSASVVTRLVNGQLVAARHQGKYWMYWGEGEIRLATSDDLVNWTPGPVVMKKRPGKFDSAFPEAGPPAVMTERGIVFIYNGKNAHKNGDPALKGGVYSGGQALFDANEPAKLLRRTGSPFYKPEADFERTGQYGDGTTFLEGLVYFKGRWMLYYGCADSFVAVAVAHPEKQ